MKNKPLSYESYREINQDTLLQMYCDKFCIDPNFEEFMQTCYEEYQNGI